MALAIEEPQVLLLCEDDPTPWHHRVLSRRLHDPTWVLLSPDHDLQVENLGGLKISPLMRGGALPRQVRRAEDYLFASSIARLVVEARRPSAPRLGSEIPADTMNDANTWVIRGSLGLALLGDSPRWTFAERVAVGEALLWEDEKRRGGGRDPRLGAPAPPDSAHGVVALGEAMAAFRPRDLSAVSHWPHDWPRVCAELLRGIRSLGLTLFTCHENWARQSGCHPESAIVGAHKVLCGVIGLAVGYDRLDVSNVSAIELVARRLIMVERAVRANPKAPNFTGLHRMNSMEEGGGVATKEFTAHMAEHAAAEARILRQTRLLREEIRRSDENLRKILAALRGADSCRGAGEFAAESDASASTRRTGT